MSRYPEHDKLKARRELREFTQELGDWLVGTGASICVLRCDNCNRGVDGSDECPFMDGGQHSYHYWPVPGSMTDQLAAIFGVDLVKLETEKRALLQQAWADGR